MLFMLLVTNPFAFGYRTMADGDALILVVVLTTFALPVFAVFILYMMGWIESIQMPTREERIGPLLITFLMNLTLYLHISGGNIFPWFFQVCVLGVVIGIFLAFFMNNFTKISLHSVGMGGLVAMTLLMVNYFTSSDIGLSLPIIGAIEMSMRSILFLVILIAGFVCTARLYLGAHHIQDVYGGFIIGFFAQLIAFLILQ